MLGFAAIIVALCAACGEPSPGPPNPDNGQQQSPSEEAEVNGLQTDPPQADVDPDGGYTLEVPIEYVGEHLEPTKHDVPVDSWLEASGDQTLAALPGRARGSVGTLFQPSASSATQESFWMHVITDRSKQDAIDWIKYLASQEPGSTRFHIPRQHEVFQASFLPAPLIGDASVSIELLNGHYGGCWRTELLVFAQDGYIVMLRNGIEVTREEEEDAQPAGRGAARCQEPDLVPSLTDIDTIAQAISERLYADRQDQP